MPDQKKIRVLIVDDIAETRESVRRSLQFDDKIDVAGTAKNGEEAITLTGELKPDVIIMDVNMPGMDGIAVTEAVRKQNPSIQIIILSVQSDPSYMRRAMLAGACDFLSKPSSIDDITTAIHRAGKLAFSSQAEELKKSARQQISHEKGPDKESLGMVIVVYSPKGGAGCTTISSNLALALMANKKRVLLIDGSTQFGDVAVFLNLQTRNHLDDLTTRVDELDEDVVLNVVTIHPQTGLNILPAPPSPELAERISGEQFAKLLNFLRNIYDFVVVDTNSYLSEVVQSGLAESDLIVLITTQDIPAVKSANQFLGLADATGISRQRILFIMNNFDKRIGITPERVAENLKQEVKLAIPFDEKLLVKSSINKGTPLLVENKAHPVSRGILQLAHHIREQLTANSKLS